MIRLLYLTLGIFSAVLSGLAAEGTARPAFARAPYIQFSTTNRIYVVWRSEGPMKPVVKFGPSLRRLSTEVSEADEESRGNIVVRASLGTNTSLIPARWQRFRTPENLKLPKLHSAPVGTFQYEVKLTGLSPSTKYYYAVFDGSKRLTPAEESYSFVTPPPIGTRQPIRFWALGDGGTGRAEQHDVYLAMLQVVQREHHPIDFWLHLGDMAYGTGRDMEFQSRFFESYESTLRSAVCWPTMGNHEGYTSKGPTGVGPYYDAFVVPTRGQAGGLASGSEAYYSFDWANVHFVCLNSHDMERKPDKPMARWLKADLEKTRADWIIAFWHHPPYTKGSHDADKEKDMAEMRQYIMPVCESGGVDLVLSGHSHIYERSMLIDGVYGATSMVAENNVLDDGDGDPESDGAYRKSRGIHAHEGTVAVVAGNAGAAMSRKGTASIMKRTIMEYGSVLVDVDGDTLTGRMVNRSGSVRDLFSLVKRGKVEPVRLALPWQPEEYKKPTSNAPADDYLTQIRSPVNYKTLIPMNAEWQYLAGDNPHALFWTRRDFDASQWKRGIAGFGFGTAQVRTPVPRERGKPSSVYLRHEFTIEQADRVTEIGLIIDYSDGFVAYVNGREVARRGIGRSSGRNVQKIQPRAEEAGFVYVALKDAHKYLKDGVNILSIEAHSTPDALGLFVDPYLILED